MSKIIRHGINEDNAWSEIVEAGDYVFLSFCAGNVGMNMESQVHGALDDIEERLRTVGLKLESVVKVDVMMRDVWNIPIMEKVFRERFKGAYPARKTISTDFAHASGENGLHVQIDAIAYKKARREIIIKVGSTTILTMSL
ncbi:MAG: RidA family protein [Defluviitaleaceae bacterium]|nr:RidA family protein [Defluviitaleaceae bacterium]